MFIDLRYQQSVHTNITFRNRRRREAGVAVVVVSMDEVGAEGEAGSGAVGEGGIGEGAEAISEAVEELAIEAPEEGEGPIELTF